jgi:2-oxoglutarate dehydrogenase E1 component
MVSAIAEETNQCLNAQFDAEKEKPRIFPGPRFFEVWKSYTGEYSHDPVKTAVSRSSLMDLANRLNQTPQDFVRNPKLDRILKQRLDVIAKGEGIDWANAENLAFGSLVAEGAKIRLSGQDSARGTFSQRHAVVFDTNTGQPYSPLNSVATRGGAFEVFNSSLSEMAVVGFEYGYSTVQPQCLTLWEAQFGDFVNNAQSMIDLYLAAGQAKWQRLSGLVMLLPHGWEGLGPEHSSARLERFLQLCAGDNMIVCYPSTPAQYFHLLRRQALVSYRKPLIVMTPKSLLRNPLAVSNLQDLTSGGFAEVLDDALSPAKQCTRVLFTSGKLYYELQQYRLEKGHDTSAIIRLEQFYPFPEKQLQRLLKSYQSATEWIWVQEEPENMGGYTFIRPRLEALLNKTIRYVGRKPASSPATGFHNIYRTEQAAVVENAFKTIQ